MTTRALEGSEDRFALDVAKRAAGNRHVQRGCGGERAEVGGLYLVTLCVDGGLSDDIAELADVAGPGMMLEKAPGRG